MTVTIDPAGLRRGRVRARYFRENFAQAGIDLVQIVPELVTNADAAIATAEHARGRIHLRFGPPDPEFLRAWRRELRRLGVPALLDWRHEVVCTDDGEGVDAETVDRRLGALGVTPERENQRGLFGRGLRDVRLAQGGGRIQGVRGGRAVESWFFPAGDDEPYAYVHVVDGEVTAAVREGLGIDRDGTRVTVPLAVRRLPPNARLVGDLVQLRPILDDPDRELWLELPGEPLGLVSHSHPEADRAAGAVRHGGRGAAGRFRPDRGSPGGAAHPPQPVPGDPPGRPRHPFRPGRPRGHAGRAGAGRAAGAPPWVKPAAPGASNAVRRASFSARRPTSSRAVISLPGRTRRAPARRSSASTIGRSTRSSTA